MSLEVLFEARADVLNDSLPVFLVTVSQVFQIERLFIRDWLLKPESLDLLCQIRLQKRIRLAFIIIIVLSRLPPLGKDTVMLAREEHILFVHLD